MSKPKTIVVGARLNPQQLAALERLGAATGNSTSGALAELAPSEGLSWVLGIEAGIAGGLAQAQERLIAEGLIARMVRAKAVDPGSEALALNPPFVFGLWRRWVETIADEIAPSRQTTAGMIERLRSDNPETRLWAGISLAHALGVEMQQSGASREEAEMGVGRDLANLLGKAMSGDAVAVDRIEAAIAEGVHRAGVAEPSAEVRRLAATHSPLTLLELAAAEKDSAAREDLLAAMFLRIGGEASPAARERIGGLVAIADRLASGGLDAYAAAHRWIVANLLTGVEA